MKDIQIPKISSRPRLEQFVGGASRADMKRVDDFRQRSPGDGVPASRKTEAWIGYDDQNFYAVFVCQSPAGETRARMAKREDIFSDDVVGVILDTYHDRQRGYEFFVNPYGVQADAIESEAQNDDFSFDTLWYSEGRLTPEGFAAMLSIPFRSLRFARGGPQTWGIALMRIIPTTSENLFWPFVTLKVEGFNQQMGTMRGLENISPGRNLQLIPYAAFAGSHFLDNPASGIPAFRGKTDVRAGLDAKAVLHDSLTLDVALNPDFSQVESDDPQVTVNQRFEVQFPEKRPFFLDNAAYFGTPENLFFSRRIIDPEFGARLTGKLGRWNLGLLGIDDRAAGRALDPADRYYGERAAIGVVRAQREFGKQSNVGVLLTDREFAGGYNRVEALDTRLKLDDHWTFSGQAMASQTVEEDGTRFGGDAFNFDLHRQSRNYTYDVQYIDRGEGFHTDLGFVTRVDMRQVQQFAARRYHPKSKVVLSVATNLYTMAIFDHKGVQQDWRINPGFNIELPRSTFFSVSRGEAFERFQNINFRHAGTGFGGHSEYFKRATFDANYNFSTTINYNPSANLLPFLASERDVQADFTFRPTARLKLEELYFYTALRTRDAAVFVNHLARSRLNYQFTRELSLRMIVDYNGVLANPQLVNLTRQKRITGDVLLTYLIHPGTALYLGYTDRLENLRLLPGAPPTVSTIGFPSTTTARQFFAKVSYLFRF
ncbi:MAG: rane associated hydrolase [Candidatus Solibacter sp.]|nr:rane associated hydrolase [Candidatus Solibacter sp.]